MSPVVSTLRIAAVIFLQFHGEHGVNTRPGTWVLIWALDQIITEVLVLVVFLVTLLICNLTVRHWLLMATAGLLGCPVVPMAAQYHHHSYSGQQQEGTASRQHIVPVGRLCHHCLYCGLHPWHGTPWRAGGHITGLLSGQATQTCRLLWKSYWLSNWLFATPLTQTAFVTW